MPSLRAWVALATLLAACLAPSFSHAENDAQTTEARRLYAEAKKAMADKKYKEAALGFEAAGTLKTNAVALYTAAQAWELAGEPARAADAFALALSTPTLSDAQTKRSEERLQELLKGLGVVAAKGSEGTKVQLDDHSSMAVPARLHGKPGDHEVTIKRADGSTEQRTVSLAAGETFEMNTDPQPEPQAAKPDTEGKIPLAEPKKRPVKPESSGAGPWKAIGFISVGAGVAALGGAVLMWQSAQDAKETYDKRPTRETLDHAKGLESNSNLLLIGGGVLTAAGAGLLIWQATKKDGREGQSLAVRAAPGAVWAGGRF